MLRHALLPALSVPLVMGLFLGATAWGFAADVPVTTLVPALTVTNFLAIVILEQLLPRRPDANLLRDRQSLNDAGHGVLFAFLGEPLTATLSVLLVAVVGTLADLDGGGWWPAHWPLALQVLVALQIWGLLNYGVHRSYHRFAALWPFHALHHDTPQMHVLKSGRLHIGERTLDFALIFLPMMLLGIPTEILVWVGLWNVYDGNLSHSNVGQRFPRFAHYLFQTAQVHALHHARNRALQDSNFSGPTALWDWVFGTFRHPDDHPFDALGLAENEVPPGFLAQVVQPFRETARRARALIDRRPDASSSLGSSS